MKQKASKYIRTISVFLILVISYLNLSAKTLYTQPIWYGETHAAFTSLVHFCGAFYCAFRNANMHVDMSGNDCGSIKILQSYNGIDWDEYLSFSVDGYDLRDPQLTITPRGEIMLITEKVLYRDGDAKVRNTCVSFIRSREDYTPLRNVNFAPAPSWNWIWNVEWIDGEILGFCYAPFFAMVKSIDGINYELVQHIDIDRNPTETSITKISRNRLLALARTDGMACIGIYDKRLNEWNWKDCDEMIACPKLVKVHNRILVAGRSYTDGLQTTLYKYKKIKKGLKRIVSIPGGKDCSYPGLVYVNGNVYITYHKGDVNCSDVYIAKLNY